MGILAYGTTLADFTSGTVPTTRSAYTTAAQKAPYVAEGVNLQGLDGGQSFPIAPTADVWSTFHYFHGSSNASGIDLWVARNSGVDLFRIRSISTSAVKMEYFDGAVWQIVIASTTLSNAVRYRLDIHTKMDNASGVVELFVDSISVGSLSGDTIFTASTNIDEIFIRAADNDSSSQGFSALIVADEDTRAMIYSQTAINGAGTNTDWTGDYTAVDEVGVSDADFISSATPGDIETVAFGNLAAEFATGHDVVGVGVTARAAKGAAGPGFVKPVVRSGATIGEGTSQALDLTWAPKQHFFPLDPNTAAAWTPANVDAAEIGVKSTAA